MAKGNRNKDQVYQRADGTYALRWVECGSCGAVIKPEHCSRASDGVLALARCAPCGCSVYSVMGEPAFITEMQAWLDGYLAGIGSEAVHAQWDQVETVGGTH